MTCYYPIPAYKTPNGVVFSQLQRFDIIGDIKLPCGMCIGCRMKRASDWTIRIMHEASRHKDNSFVTLTYSDENLPINNSLAHKHFSDFMKRLRWHTPARQIKYYMCGEYGEANNRPHYHACIFNRDFHDRIPKARSGSNEIVYDSNELREIWGRGHISVQDLTEGTAAYCARYIMKKQLGRNASYDIIDPDTGEITERDPEYNRMSLKDGGIAGQWYAQFHADIHAFDYAIVNGSKRGVPRYYDKLLKRRNKDQYELIKLTRAANALTHWQDQTPERLAVREHVHIAQLRNLKRDQL